MKTKEKAIKRKKKEKKKSFSIVPPVPEKGKLITNPVDGSSVENTIGNVYTEDVPEEEDLAIPDDEFEEEIPENTADVKPLSEIPKDKKQIPNG